MEKILNITGRIEEKKQKQQAESYRNKIETAQRIVRCSSCHFRCAMCGYHLESSDRSSSQVLSHLDLCLCENCRNDFEEFLSMRNGKKESDIPWHNKAWLKLWSSWVDYQQAIREFSDSDEFKQSYRLLIVDD